MPVTKSEDTSKRARFAVRLRALPPKPGVYIMRDLDARVAWQPQAPADQVATVGRIQAIPGAYNVVPGKVILGLDVRDLDEARINMVFDRIHDDADQIAQFDKK